MIFLAADIESSWRSLLLFLCQAVYKLIAILYDLFEVIGTADIITNEVLTTLYNRIGTLLGVYMLFRLIFSFIQMLINPDYISDKEKGIGKIVSKVLITLVLIAITPFLFEKAMELQNFIVGVNGEGNVIAKVILPNQDIETYEDFGSNLSAYLFTNFYRYDDSIPIMDRNCPLLNTPEEDAQGKESPLFTYISTSKGSVNKAKDCLNEKQNGEYMISFTSNGIFAVIIGGLVCYILLTYTLMVGVRVIQLVFLRIISPMAILTFLSSKKDTMFSKWLKMCTTTYLDLFIRMAIIYFIVYIISLVIRSDTGIALVKDYDKMWVINIVMILALLTFAKKAPELLKELFPSSGAGSLGFGLKSPKKMFESMLGGSTLYKAGTWGAKAATAGALLGFGTAGISAVSRFRANRHNGKNIGQSLLGAAGGFSGGFFRGLRTGAAKGNVFKNAAKGYNDQRTADDKYDQLITSGGSTYGKIISGLTSYVGETKGQTYTRQLHNLDTLTNFKKDIQNAADEISVVKAAKTTWEQAQKETGETVAQFEARKQSYYNRYKALRDGSSDAAIAGNKIVSGTYESITIDSRGKKVKARVRFSENIDNDNDNLYAGDISAKFTEAQSFVKNRNVEVWDNSTGSYERVNVGSLTNRSDLSTLVDRAHETKTHIYSTEENYQQAIANDKAAGVDSNATVNK